MEPSPWEVVRTKILKFNHSSIEVTGMCPVFEAQFRIVTKFVSRSFNRMKKKCSTMKVVEYVIINAMYWRVCIWNIRISEQVRSQIDRVWVVRHHKSTCFHINCFQSWQDHGSSGTIDFLPVANSQRFEQCPVEFSRKFYAQWLIISAWSFKDVRAFILKLVNSFTIWHLKTEVLTIDCTAKIIDVI